MAATATSFDRIITAAKHEGLEVRVSDTHKAQIQTPGHGDRDRGTSVTYIPHEQKTLIYSFNDDNVDQQSSVTEFLEHIGLTVGDLYDENYSRTYNYSDGFSVVRSAQKTFTQCCAHGVAPSKCTKGCKDKIRALYGVESLNLDGMVFITEGEKDVDAIHASWSLPAVSQHGGANARLNTSDWSVLDSRDVTIVADNDDPGIKRAQKLAMHLQKLDKPPASISVVRAAEGKDAADHIVTGHSPQDFVTVGDTVARRRVKLIQATQVKTEKVSWLIDEWIPAGMLTLLAGREGLGKSTIACSWVAEFSKKGMKCAYLNSEDSRAFTVKPRLQAAGADLNNVYFIDVVTETGAEGHLRLPSDTEILFYELASKGVKFVILDAAKSSMDPKLDGYKDDHVRQFLEPLASCADRYGITIVGLAHFGKQEGKDTGKLLLGSIAWSQIARSVLAVALDDAGELVVSNTKANLASKIVNRKASIASTPVQTDDGELTQVGVIQWGEFTDDKASDFLEQKQEGEFDERSEIEAVVVDYLISQGGSAPAKDVLKVTNAAGLSDNAVKKARKKFGVSTTKAGMGAGWMWTIDIPFPKVPEDSEGSRTYIRASSAPSGESSGQGNGDSDPNDPAAEYGLWPEPTKAAGDGDGNVYTDAPRNSSGLPDGRSVILEALSDSHALSQGAIMRQVREVIGSGADVPDELDRMKSEGLIAESSPGKFIKRKAA
ncbi:AAA family ATPase [Corynebacterium dentalis]|uniref:AAA family ATPase n=1 Tax=Corynebacterium dentalis TaxID=2014528 RepID=UPI000C071529|nr:AAA family ATPase [Corynebacterium dentalis]